MPGYSRIFASSSIVSSNTRSALRVFDETIDELAKILL